MSEAARAHGDRFAQFRTLVGESWVIIALVISSRDHLTRTLGHTVV